MRRYRRMARRWHRPASRALRRAYEQADPPPLLLRPIWMERTFRLEPQDEQGGFSEDALRTAARALASKDGGDTVPIHPRLVELLYDAMRHFDSPFVWVISGYREEGGDSRHTRGRAVDIVLPGVEDRALARHLSWQGFVGVGYYPNSGFVHVDVREHSYFWIDRSLPGRRSRHRPILRGRAAKADRRARRRGIEPAVDAPGAPQADGGS